MPTYQYRCTECGHDLEVVQKFTDAALTECPNCRGQLRKIFNAVGVVFKGSGFYRNDSRPQPEAESGGESSKTTVETDGKGAGGKETGGKEAGGKDAGGKKSGASESGGSGPTKTDSATAGSSGSNGSSTAGAGSSTGQKASAR
jgi:putative FmdB family regulatory protein